MNDFHQMPVMGILRDVRMDELMELLPLCADAGLSAVEITMNSLGAPKMIEQANHRFGNILSIGAGTVCNLPDFRAAKDAGAAFIVMPTTEPDVIRVCVDDGIPVFPGAMTPTEVHVAWQMGATMVKLFPAKSMGPEYIRDILAPLAHIPILATGGINLDQLEPYWSAGVKGFGIGSPLFPKVLVEAGAWAALGEHLSAYVIRMKELM